MWRTRTEDRNTREYDGVSKRTYTYEEIGETQDDDQAPYRR